MEDTARPRGDGGKAIEIARIACLAGGACLIAAAAGFAVHTERFILHSASAQGTVIGLVASRRDGDMKMTYAPVFAFTANNGRAYTITSNSGSNPPEFALGDQVAVLYEARDPNGAKIDSFLQLWLFPICFGFIGVVATLIGRIFLRIERGQAAHRAFSAPETAATK